MFTLPFSQKNSLCFRRHLLIIMSRHSPNSLAIATLSLAIENVQLMPDALNLKPAQIRSFIWVSSMALAVFDWLIAKWPRINRLDAAVRLSLTCERCPAQSVCCREEKRSGKCSNKQSAKGLVDKEYLLSLRKPRKVQGIPG